jgi:heme/copper-type cytochrome/quinol oxidase subunit 2
MLAGAVAVLGLVMALLALAFRPARVSRPMAQESSLPSAQLWLVGGGVVFPSVVLLALLTYGLIVGERLIARPHADPGTGLGPLAVTAEASRWQWTFGYPSLEAGTKSVGRLHIPVGRPIDVHIRSLDVIHSFWVPRLAGKVDAIPGRTNVLRLEAREPGVYAGLCAEYCGTGHARHGFEVVAHDPQDWSRAVTRGGPPASATP